MAYVEGTEPSAGADEAVTYEDARRAGAADGRNQALCPIFIIDPTYRPVFFERIDSHFSSMQSRLLMDRTKALGQIERHAHESSVSLTRRVNELQAITTTMGPERLALGRPVAREGATWGEVRPLTHEEADQERLERDLRRNNAQIEAHVTSLTTVSNNWMQCWTSFHQQAQLALERANSLGASYKEGLLDTHQHAEEIARRWRPPEFRLRDEWFQDPATRLQDAIPRGVRDSATQAWEQWLDLWRTDTLPRPIEGGDHRHEGR
ncbi:hypothetical protein [Sphaerisporangium aureirubrum]|uniref:Uncharacterized protein n=1 Tax=Sphaerisporangium aureirubrum TaxID=1544736 RepID=A0ABW1NT52_9ACTN